MTPSDAPLPHVRLHLWGVSTGRVASAFARMGSQRLPLQRLQRDPHGPTFAKLLGTARPTTFTPRDSDPRHWGLLTVWHSASDADAFDDTSVARSWERIADEAARIAMTPLASRGRWSGREPFGAPAPRRYDGPVAAITRARVRPTRLRSFWHHSAMVATSLADHDGLLLATGIGEAPVGLQGTFSMWRSVADMNTFARTDARHLEAIDRTPLEGWYAEELFARLSIDAVRGSFAGISLDTLMDGVEA
jgi:hypothetical protein